MKTTSWLLGALTALSLGACGVPNETSIEILGAIPYDATVDETTGAVTSCIVSGDATVKESAGAMDLALRTAAGTVPGFQQGFVVRNNLPDNTNESSSRLNSNNFTIDKVVVGFSAIDEATATAVSGFQTEVPMVLKIETGGTQGVNVPLIPSNIATGLEAIIPAGTSQTLIANFRLEGRTGGQIRISTGEVSFPVQVCNGCLVDTCGPECLCSHSGF